MQGHSYAEIAQATGWTHTNIYYPLGPSNGSSDGTHQGGMPNQIGPHLEHEAVGGDARVDSDRPGDPTDSAPQGLCLDRGYDCEQVRELAVACGFEQHIRTRGEDLAKKVRDPTWRPRWVAEACHS